MKVVDVPDDYDNILSMVRMKQKNYGTMALALPSQYSQHEGVKLT